MRSREAVFGLFLAAPLLAGLPRAEAAPEGEEVNACLDCHRTLNEPKLRAPAKEHAAGAHRDPRLGCVACHKGDADNPTVDGHKGAGFRPHPQRAAVAEVCGGCHDDAAFMRRINARLPVGQLALYKLSQHGKDTAAGDEATPDCTDCHGRHDVVAPSSPASPVHRLNVARVCGKCHADPKRMARFKMPADQVAKWERGVHGQAFKHGDAKAPSCTGCHGAHSATPPEAASVGHVCGRCHEKELGFFEQSPHQKGFGDRGLGQCVACHGNHDIPPASAMLVGTTADSTCMKCHNDDAKPRKVAEEMAALLHRARDGAAGARVAVARARARGLHVPGATYSLAQVSTAEIQLRGVVHALDPQKLEGPVAAVEAAVAETQGLIAEAERARGVERRGYYVALALATALLIALGLRAHALDASQR